MKTNSIQFLKAFLLKEMEEGKMCPECNAPMKEGMCNECGYMEEELVGGQKKLDVAPPFGKLTGDDFKKLGNKNEAEDHEVSMANNSLRSIVSAASQLIDKIGREEKDIPAWIQDHITNAENYINQAAKNYHEYENGGEEDEYDEEPADDSLAGIMQEMLSEAKKKKKKPSAGLTKKQKSATVKKAVAGKDIGKKGKGFAAIEKKAKASGADNPKAVAAAAMWKGVKSRAKK